MRRDDRIAERYARALFLIAERRGRVPEALDGLQGLLGLLDAVTRGLRSLAHRLQAGHRWQPPLAASKWYRDPVPRP